MNEKSILDIEVSAFPSYKGTTPKNVNLLAWLKSLKYEIKVKTIRETNDDQLKKKLKSELPAITPSGIFNRRKSNELISHSGFLQFDIDFKDNLHIKNYSELKSQISNLKEVAYCGLSVSGKGYWGLVRITDPKRHKEHFEALFLAFKKLDITIDKSCKDVCRLRGYSIDKNAYFNHSAPLFSIKESSLNKRKTENFVHNDNLDSNKYNVERNLNIIQNRLIDITGNYEDWFALGCSLANEFGESGREYYHIISNVSNKYDYKKTDDQFNLCLKSKYGFNIGTFFHYCKINGI